MRQEIPIGSLNPKPERVTEINDLSQRLLKESQYILEVTSNLESRLSSILRREPPSPPTHIEKIDEHQSTSTPLGDSMLDCLIRIEEASSKINSIIDRSEN